MADLPGNVPRVIALIDLPDLRRQAKRFGGAFGNDLSGLPQQLEAGLVSLDPVGSEARLSLGVVYVYSPQQPVGADRPCETEGVIFKQSGSGAKRECWGCYKACTHCQAGTTDQGGQSGDNRIADDLIELAREDAYDWAVVVSTDLPLIPVVRYLQSHGRKIIHGCFPPVAMDLTKECWASIDLRPGLGSSAGS